MMPDNTPINDIRRIGETGTNAEKFCILKHIVNLYNYYGFNKNFQNIFFVLLENKNNFEPYKNIINSLIREIGLFPYIEEGEIENFKDLIAINTFLSPLIRDTKTIFHYPQAKVFYTIMSGQSVILSAPTSFGKSLIIDAIIATHKFKNIVIIVPTIALIDETRKRLSIFSNEYKIITHHMQEKKSNNIYILTQERAIVDGFIGDVDFFIIDEFYKLSPQSPNINDTRCDTLNLAFYKLYKKCHHFYMLGPNIDGLAKQVEGSISYVFMRENFPTVGTTIYRINENPTANKIFEIYSSNKNSTLIYCNSPLSTSDMANELAVLKNQIKDDPIINEVCTWIEDTYHKDWSLINCLKHGIGVHHARLPRALSQLIIELFNLKKLDVLLCTSTIIEGVNTSAKNVIIQEQKIGQNELDFFTFNNIAGRAGRMFKHFIGNVFIFSDQPQQNLPCVDIPTLSQSGNTSLNILIGMDIEDLNADSYEKISEYYENKNDILSIDTIKLNPHIIPDQQLKLAKDILANSNDWHPILNWSGIPSYDQLQFICNIMFTYFEAKSLASRSVASYRQLAFFINRLKDRPTTKSIIESDIQNALNNGYDTSVDKIITNQLNFIRMWANYHFPRLLMAISSIQKEIFERLEKNYGDYSHYASSVESLFFDTALICLEEYGIPIDISRKIIPQIAKGNSLDQTLEALKAINIKNLPLSRGEKMFLTRAVKFL